jgi:hypothetical protein
LTIREFEKSSEQIRDIKASINGSNLIIRWKWPRSISLACIFRTSYDEKKTLPELLETEKPKVYTKEEYQNSDGYLYRIQDINLYRYYIYPCVLEGSEVIILNQPNEENIIVASTGKANIEFKISEKKKLFSSQKTVAITIVCDTHIPKDVLCYVKKKGGIPSNVNDGTKFNFLQDFEAGRTDTASIDIAKDEYIKIYFTDGKRFGEIYNLKTM